MIIRTFIVFMLCSPLVVIAGGDTITAMNRTNEENYKDMALAACISTIYEGTTASEDANITTSAFLEWTYYDLDKGNAAIAALVQKYLRRDYSNPTEGYAGAKFDLLKCLDMYHSQELDDQTKKYVPHPNWIGDKPSKAERKQDDR